MLLRIDENKDIEVLRKYNFKYQPWAIDSLGEKNEFAVILTVNENMIYIYEIRKIPRKSLPIFENVLEFQIGKYTCSFRNNEFFMKGKAFIACSMATHETPEGGIIAVHCSLENESPGFLKLYFLTKGNKKLKFTRFFDMSIGYEQISRLYNLNIYGFIGKKLIITGVGNQSNSQILTLIFDFKNRRLSEKMDLRVNKVGTGGIYGLCQVGNELIGIGRNGKLVVLRYFKASGELKGN